MKKNQTVAVNNFIYRQTKYSGKSYTINLSFEEIALHAQHQLSCGKFKEGYRDGVIIVQAKTKLIHRFICPFIEIDDNTQLKAIVTRRRSDEDPYIQIRALNGVPLKTESVDIILYRHDVLAETNEQTSNTDWELISFHSIPEGVHNMPMGPVTMMRNQLQLIGGTKAYYKSEDWAASVSFWQKYAILDVKSSKIVT